MPAVVMGVPAVVMGISGNDFEVSTGICAPPTGIRTTRLMSFGGILDCVSVITVERLLFNWVKMWVGVNLNEVNHRGLEVTEQSTRHHQTLFLPKEIHRGFRC